VCTEIREIRFLQTFYYSSVKYVESGNETPAFVHHFHAWNRKKKDVDVDPFEKRQQRWKELKLQTYQAKLDLHAAEKLERLERIRNQITKPKPKIKVDWRPVLIKMGFSIPEPEPEKPNGFNLAPGDPRTVFHWDDPYALAVMITGSWDNWESEEPMILVGDGKFATAINLPPGRYKYRYKVASSWGVGFYCDDRNPVAHDEEGKSYNIVRVLRKKGEEAEPEVKNESTNTEKEGKGKEQSFGRVVFSWDDSTPVAVMIYADWQEDPIPMVQTERGFNKILHLDPGRYYYRYKLAYEDTSPVWATDSDREVITKDGEQYNFLQVYAKLTSDKKKYEELLELEKMTVEEKKQKKYLDEVSNKMDDSERRKKEREKKMKDILREEKRQAEEARMKREEEEKEKERRKREERQKKRLAEEQEKFEKERKRKQEAEQRDRERAERLKQTDKLLNVPSTAVYQRSVSPVHRRLDLDPEAEDRAKIRAERKKRLGL